jgi:ATP-binding cassette subfamily C protein LapB
LSGKVKPQPGDRQTKPAAGSRARAPKRLRFAGLFRRITPGGFDPFAGLKLSPVVYLSSLFINLLALVPALVILQVIDRVLPNQSRETLFFLMLGLVGVLIVDAVLRISRSYLVGWAATQHDFRVKMEAITRILYAPETSFGKLSPSTYLDRLNALDTMRDHHGGEARLLLLDLPFAAIFLGLIFLLGGALVAVPLVLFVLFGLAVLKAGAAISTLDQRRQDHDERRQDFMIETLEGIATVKAMAMEPKFQRRFERLRLASAGTNFSLIKLSNSAQALGNLFTNLTMVAVAAGGAFLVIGGNLTLGALACCSLLSGHAIDPLLRALSLRSRMHAIAVARAQVRALFELPPVLAAKADVSGKIDGAISVRHMTYARNGRHTVFTDVNLDIPPGRFIGFTGPDGSGKTTLLKLLSGAIAPTTGKIMIDGINTESEAMRGLAGQIGYLSARSEMFQGTVLENLTMFQAGNAIEQGREAAALIGLEQDIHRLPDGYATMLGAGIVEQLPYGMLQRIAIARALGRRPKILLFDEANASLDARGDKLLIQGLAELKGAMTIIVASNRPSLLALADQVYHLADNGLHQADQAQIRIMPQLKTETGVGA